MGEQFPPTVFILGTSRDVGKTVTCVSNTRLPGDPTMSVGPAALSIRRYHLEPGSSVSAARERRCELVALWGRIPDPYANPLSSSGRWRR